VGAQELLSSEALLSVGGGRGLDECSSTDEDDLDLSDDNAGGDNRVAPAQTLPIQWPPRFAADAPVSMSILKS
jgi:hypothetical protein